MKARSGAWIGLLAALLLVSSGAARAAGEPVITADENAARAALLYKLSRFVTWPERAFAADSSPLVIAVVDNEPLSSALEAIEGKRVQGRVVQTRRFRPGDDMSPAHLLYVSDEEAAAPFTAAPWALTVTGEDHRLEAGLMLAVWIEGEHLAFSVNLPAARTADLHIDSNLLRLAKRVLGGPMP